MNQTLTPTAFINSDHPLVVEFASEAVGDATEPVERAKRLYVAVRDGVRYDPHSINFDPNCYVASNVIGAPGAYCIPKAVLLCAAARALGQPAMLGFADVRNHLTTEKLQRAMGTDLFIYHGYAALYLNGRWLKVTPTFNVELCERFGVPAMEFDGENDALLHAYDRDGRRHMEYVTDRGMFEDLPFDEIRTEFRTHYPEMMSDSWDRGGSRFEDEQPLA